MSRYVKGEDGLYEVATPFGSAWYSEKVFKAAYKAVQDAGLDPETDVMALFHACGKELDKGLIPGADLIADLLAMGIGTEEYPEDEDDDWEGCPYFGECSGCAGCSGDFNPECEEYQRLLDEE